MSNSGDISDTLEWHAIPKGETFYDDVEHRFFINACNHGIKIGFGHNIRKLEMIGIADHEDIKQDSVLDAREGEIIEEDV